MAIFGQLLGKIELLYSLTSAHTSPDTDLENCALPYSMLSMKMKIMKFLPIGSQPIDVFTTFSTKIGSDETTTTTNVKDEICNDLFFEMLKNNLLFDGYEK